MLVPLKILESHSKQVANMHQGYFVVQLGLDQNLCNSKNIGRKKGWGHKKGRDGKKGRDKQRWELTNRLGMNKQSGDWGHQLGWE